MSRDKKYEKYGFRIFLFLVLLPFEENNYAIFYRFRFDRKNQDLQIVDAEDKM